MHIQSSHFIMAVHETRRLEIATSFMSKFAFCRLAFYTATPRYVIRTDIGTSIGVTSLTSFNDREDTIGPSVVNNCLIQIIQDNK